jgi:hypothetical protein
MLLIDAGKKKNEEAKELERRVNCKLSERSTV